MIVYFATPDNEARVAFPNAEEAFEHIAARMYIARPEEKRRQLEETGNVWISYGFVVAQIQRVEFDADADFDADDSEEVAS